LLVSLQRLELMWIPMFCIVTLFNALSLDPKWTKNVRTVTLLFCVGMLRQNWTFCDGRLYSCLVTREKITITFVERFIRLLLVSSYCLSYLQNFTSYTGCRMDFHT
jgi:hypothetical protein